MLYNIFLIMLISGVVLFIVAFVLLFVLKVPDLIDELSGNKAKRQIKRLKELNSGTGNLESVATNDVYKSLSSGTLKVEEDIIEEDDEDVIREVSREIDTDNLMGKDMVGSVTSVKIEEVEKSKESEEQPTGYMPEKIGSEEEQTTGYILEKVGFNDSDEEQATGYMPESEKEEEPATGYMDETEQPTGYMKEYEEATGFMQNIDDEEEATGVLSELKDFTSNRQLVEIIEEQTSLNLSAVL